MRAPTGSYLVVFWSRVQKSSGCWEWIGKTNADGYGRATISTRTVMLAHRASWLIHNGDLNPTQCVLHRCDNRRCVRPDHLFLGDRRDNNRDMARKGRQWLQRHPERALRGDNHPSRKHPERLARGERHPHAKLSDDQVVMVRTRFASGETKRALALEFRVSDTTIGYITSGALRKHLPGPTFPPRHYNRKGA